MRAVRETLRRIRDNERLGDLFLFGRRTPERMLNYIERRGSPRGPVRRPVYVTPVTFNGTYVQPLDHGEASILAVTKDLSLRGIGFTHDEPFDGAYAIVTFDLWNEEPVSVLLEVRWSNLRRGHAYLSGGRFLAISATPDF